MKDKLDMMTNHKHLRSTIEDIYLNNNELNEDLAFRLINEFRYSNLFIPAKRENGTLNFIIYETDGAKLTPLFTDMDEYRKFYRDEDFQVFQNSFELYQNVLKTTEIEGYILNPASEKYLFTKEFILSIKNVPKSNFYSNNPFTAEELRDYKDSIDNSPLEAFIENPQNVGYFEGLFEMLSNSAILALMVSGNDLSHLVKDGIISMQSTGPLASMYTDKVGGIYATIFSSQDKIRAVNTDGFKYCQVINLATLVNFVLSEDMDGIILNPESDNVLIPRATLLKYSLGFEKYANNEKLSTSIFYMFPLQD